MKKIFKDSSPAGKNLIELGIIFVFIWLFIYIGLVLSPYSGLIYPTAPFLGFGVLMVLLGFSLRKKKKRKKVDRVGGIEELLLTVLAFEFIPAVLYFLIFLKRFIEMGDKTAISVLIIPILLSVLAFVTYWEKRKNSEFFLVEYAKGVLVLAILSHFVWVSMLTTG